VIDVAALYVDLVRGPYAKMCGVDAWGIVDPPSLFLVGRDARKYAGPLPVVAHPPCGHWGLFAWNCKQPPSWQLCAPRAVEQVREHGGVMEHPRGSQVWRACDLPRPGEPEDEWGGWTLAIDQCDWGHPCDKPTWLYVVGVAPEDMPPRPPPGTPTHCMVRLVANGHSRPELPKAQRHITPPALAEWLIEVARRAGKEETR